MTVPQYNLSKSTHQCECAPPDHHCHSERSAPQGGLSCPCGAIHLLGISWYSVAITSKPKASTAPKASLVKGRWPSDSEVGGIRSRWYEFAENQCEFADAYRMNPPPINCQGNLWAAPFDKGAMIGAYLRLFCCRFCVSGDCHALLAMTRFSMDSATNHPRCHPERPNVSRRMTNQGCGAAIYSN